MTGSCRGCKEQFATVKEQAHHPACSPRDHEWSPSAEEFRDRNRVIRRKSDARYRAKKRGERADTSQDGG